MKNLQLLLNRPPLEKGFLHLDSSLPIPFPNNGVFNNCVTYETGFVLGYYVGTSFRIIANCKLLDDARFERKRDSEIHPGREYAILLVHNSIHRVL